MLPRTPVFTWRLNAARAAWKAWSSDRRYHTVTLNGINDICAVKTDVAAAQR